MISAWLRHMFGKTFISSSRKATRRPAKFKPSVFILEERWVPTTVTAATELDLLNQLNATASGGTVDFAAGLAGSTINLFNQNPLASGSFFVINKNLTIDASALGAPGINLHRDIAAPTAFRIFEVAPTFTVTFINSSAVYLHADKMLITSC